jgi:hypothetical protein
MLVLAHREELLNQAFDKIRRANPQLKVEIDQAARNANPDCDVIVASVPTLGRKNSKRIQRLDPERFYLIVVDEAHHATAETYRRVFEYFGIFETDTQKLLVGFTATPKRGDHVGLNTVFQEIVFSRSLPEMVKAGFLSPVAGYRVETDVDLTKVKTRMGDFITSHRSRAVNSQYRNDLIVQIFKDHLKDKQTLCFCVDVAHAHSVAEAFRATGIRSAAVSGDMDRPSRSQVLDDFSAGRIQVLANCMILTEGYDEPSITGILLARPTKSSLLYTQMIGRGTRLHPGKENVTVVDIVDVTREHSLTTLPSLFGLMPAFDLEGRTIEEAEKAIRWVESNRPWVAIDRAASMSDLRYRCTQIDLLGLSVPPELVGHTRFAWTSMGRKRYRLGLSKGDAIIVAPTILGKWEMILRRQGRDAPIENYPDLPAALMKAESLVKERFHDQLRLVDRSSGWRNMPASEKQLKVLRDRKIDVPEGLTKGQASHLIGMLS